MWTPSISLARSATATATATATVPLADRRAVLPTPRAELAKLSTGRSMYYEYYTGQPGKPVYVLLHGLTKSGTYFTKETDIAQRLHGLGYGVVVVDLHGGAGRTPDQHHDRAIPAVHNSADVAAVITHLGLQNVILAGHSYGGWVALGAAAEPSIAGRLKGVYAASSYLQSLAARAMLEYWQSEDFDRAYAYVKPKLPEYAEYVERTRGRRARLATDGLPPDGVGHAPKIPPGIAVRLVNGSDNSMLPDDVKQEWRKWFNLGPGRDQTNVDRSMSAVFLQGLKRQGHRDVQVDTFRGSHLWPKEHPEDFVEAIRRARKGKGGWEYW